MKYKDLSKNKDKTKEKVKRKVKEKVKVHLMQYNIAKDLLDQSQSDLIQIIKNIIEQILMSN